MKITRRALLATAAATSAILVLTGSAGAQDGKQHDIAKLMAPAGGFVDVPLGNPAAPVTVIEYASSTCPHCAAFNAQVFPEFKAQYIDTGKVLYYIRPFARDPRDAAVFILADAAGPEMYYPLLDAYMRSQEQWAFVENAEEPIFNIAQQFGFTREQFVAALTDTDAAIAKLNALRDQVMNDFGLTGTPTFYINGKQLTGEATMEQLSAAIDPLVPADFQPPATPEPVTPTTTVAPTTTVTPAELVAPTTTVTPSATPAITTTAAP